MFPGPTPSPLAFSSWDVNRIAGNPVNILDSESALLLMKKECSLPLPILDHRFPSCEEEKNPHRGSLLYYVQLEQSRAQ